MIKLKLTFENTDQILTRFNGTFEEAKTYYLNHIFNLGVESDLLVKAVKVELIK